MAPWGPWGTPTIPGYPRVLQGISRYPTVPQGAFGHLEVPWGTPGNTQVPWGRPGPLGHPRVPGAPWRTLTCPSPKYASFFGVLQSSLGPPRPGSPENLKDPKRSQDTPRAQGCDISIGAPIPSENNEAPYSREAVCGEMITKWAPTSSRNAPHEFTHVQTEYGCRSYFFAGVDCPQNETKSLRFFV